MLSNIKLLLAGVLFLAGIFSGGFVTSLWDTYIDDPALIRKTVDEQRQICLFETAEAASKARLQEQQRQQDAADLALNTFNTQLAARRAAQDAAAQQFEQEISDYEKKLKEAGRSCVLDGDTIEWLRGPPRSPDPEPG